MKYLLLVVITLCYVPAAMAEIVAQDRVGHVLTKGQDVILGIMDETGRIEIESAIDIKASGADALVDLGSITKTVTAVAILHLIEEKQLSTQTRLSDLLPRVPEDKAAITLHQLLTHTSGLLESTGDDAERLSRSAFLERVLSTPLEAEPGTVHLYSNAGYSLLAGIIELKSNKSYETYLMEHVLPKGTPPIGYAAAYSEKQSILSNRIWLTAFQRRPIAKASWGAPTPGWNLIGNGGLVTTAEGFLTFWAAFMSERVVGRDFVEAALTPHVDEGNGDTFYGYGLVVEPGDNQNVIYWHDGGNEVFSAEWRYDTRTGVTLFTAGRGRSAFEAMRGLESGG